MTRLLLAIAVACMTTRAGAAISVGPSGSGTLTFDTLPAVSEWSTLSVAGAGTTVGSVAAMDAAVQTLNASNVNVALGSSPTVPPNLSAIAQWNSTAFYLQTRPTGNSHTVLMATLQNNTGGNVANIAVSYDFGNPTSSPGSEDPGLNGLRAYYSLSGLSGSWTLIPELTTATPGLLVAALAVGTWTNGTSLYVLWVDDNGAPGTDGSFTLDNVSFGPAVLPLTLSITNVTGGNATIITHGQPGHNVTIESSANTVDWQVVQGGTLNSSGIFQVTVSTAPSSRLYRVRDLSGGPVYSLNIVGYVNLTVPAGTAFLANPLLAVDNSVAALLPNVPPGTRLSKWNATAQVFVPNDFLGGWSDPAVTLLPGEGFAITNPTGSPLTNTFAGELLQGALTNRLAAGFSLCSSMVPQVGGLEATLGFPAEDGDVVEFWNTGQQNFDVYNYFGFSGWLPLDPTPQLGESFFALKQVPTDWIRNFSVNGGGPGFTVVHGGGPVPSNAVSFFTYRTNTAFGRVLDTDAVTPLSTSFRGQLYAGPSSNEAALSAVGAPAPFSAGPPPGYINAGPVSIPGATNGQTIYLQVRAWAPSFGASYEAAAASGGKAGKSGIFSLVISAGDSFSASPPANGFASFALTSPPIIVTQPQSQTVLLGSNAIVSVVSDGTLPLTYRWRLNGSPITNATNSSLALINVQFANAGGYSVVITNIYGAVTSVVATLTVTELDSDGDGIPDAWEISHGLDRFNPVDAALDADGDGMTNLQEYLADTDPQNSASAFAITSALLSGGQFTLQFATRTGLTYRVEYKSVSSDSVWNLLAVVPAGAGAVVQVVDPLATGPSRIYRLLAFRPGSATPAFSVNTVGYMNFNTLAGSNQVVNPFIAPDITIATLIPSPPDGSFVVTSGFVANSFFGGVWDDPFMPLPPGDAFTFFNPDVGPVALTFVGETTRPAIINQPASQIVLAGTNPTLGLGLMGVEPLNYRWRLNGTNIPGETNSTLTLPNAQPAASGNYSVVVSNLSGSVTSSVASLVVRFVNVLVNGQSYAGSSATLSNSLPFQVAFESIFPGGVIFYSLDGSNPGFGAFYSGPFNVTESATVRAVAYNSNFTQSVEMDAFTVNLLGAPVIVMQPQDQSVVAGDSANFTVTAAGPGPLRYQWRLSNVSLPGATNATLMLSNVQAPDAGPYRVIASNPSGSVTSTVAQLTLLSPPVFTSLPPAVTHVFPGSNVTFCVTASGTPPLRYQWRRNGVNLPGQTNTCFTIPNVAVTDGGSYSVVVANSAGALESPPAVLNVLVTPTPPGDNYSQSTPIFGATNFVVGTNLLATREFGEPLHAGKRGSNSVWYSWTAHSTGIATFRTAGSSFDTLLAVYTGTNVTNLLAVASDEDRGPSLTSLLRFNAGQGTNFSIAIDGFAGGQGNFVLVWELVPTANTLPVITNQPLSQTVTQGTTLTLSVVATGSGLTYQWLLNG
ncbi:MAG TPA: immunoglobulin domain-containing protein, partial [Verrucomicrobiae bacterium]